MSASPPVRQRAVVIGSGLSGLTTATLLAEAGWAVTILEQHRIPGGLMQRYQRGGCWFDTGFHLATDGGPGGSLRAILARLGILDEVRFLAPDPSAQFVVSAPGLAPLALPCGILATCAACCARFSEQAEGIERFFARLRGRLADNIWLSRLAEDASLHHDPEPLSVSAVLAECGIDGSAALLIGAAAGILAMRAESCPFDLYAAFAGTSFAGGWRVEHGGEGLTRPLVARFLANDGQLRLGCAARAILHDGNQARAVVDEQGTEHPAEMIIGAVHPDIILRLTGDHGVRPSWRQHVRATPDGAGAFLLAMKLARPAHELGPRHHFLRLADGSDAYVVAPDCWSAGSSLAGSSLAGSSLAGSSLAGSLSAGSLSAGSLSAGSLSAGSLSAGSLSAGSRPGPYHLEAMMWLPVGDTAAWAESTLGRRGSAYSAWKQARAAYLLAALEDRFPGLRAEVLASWTASPLTFRDYLGGRAGGAMGLSHDLGHLGSQTLPGRSKIRNLLFTGQNYAHPGILGCLISACTVAGAVLQRDLRQEILST